MKQFVLLLFIILVGFSLFIAGCRSSKQVQNSNNITDTFFINRSKITIGQGGGFTGGVTKYTIAKNGEVTKTQTYLQDTLIIGQLEVDALKTIDSLLAKASLLTTQFNQPGNMYQFISQPTDESTHTVTWGDYRQPPPKPIQQAYEGIMKILQALEKPED